MSDGFRAKMSENGKKNIFRGKKVTDKVLSCFRC